LSKGHFVWHDLFTTDADKAQAFYTELLGWTTYVQDMGNGPYTMFQAGDKQFGGIAPSGPFGGMPSNWVSYISVDDVDATLDQIKSLGGSQLVEPFAVPTVGRMGFATDPEGSVFALFQGEDAYVVTEVPQGVQPGGAIAWHEVTVENQHGAADFYAAVFDYGKVVWPMEDGGEYIGLTIGDAPVAGVFKRPEGAPAGFWTIYFEAPGTIDQAEADVTRLGGTVLKSKFTVEGTGDFMIAAGPTGAMIGLMKSLPMGDQ
jgi:predicted enzyme related to lactoylglutathione lyase